jgi:2-isopropylmalate synthase
MAGTREQASRFAGGQNILTGYQIAESRPSGLVAASKSLKIDAPVGVTLYDTTLRDGQQRRDVGYSVVGKIRVANKIFGTLPVGVIEGGWPGANRTDTEFFRQSQDQPYIDILSAFGMTRRAGSHVESDTNIANLLASGAPIITLVGKSDTAHVEKVFKTTLEENLAMIYDSVRYVKEQNKRVIYDAEHFFDGATRNPDYAMETLYAAAKGGAEAVVLCDTNGGKMPWEIEEWTRRVSEDPKLHQLYRKANDITDPTIKMQIGIHTHADMNMAEASALFAVKAGATQIQGTVAGLGERAGNANILVLAHQLDKEGLVQLTEEQRAGFVNLGKTVYAASGASENPHSPLIGDNVFGTTAGMHQDATLKYPDAYAHADPESFGNELKIYINNQSGKKAVADKAEQLGLDLPATAIPEIIDEIKTKEFEGFRFTRAEASLYLLMKRHEPDYQTPFQISLENGDSVKVTTNGTDSLKSETSFKSKKQTATEVFENVKKALLESYPQAEECYFEGDRVEKDNGTTRVFIRVSNGDSAWITMGVGNTIKEAQLAAVADAFEYGIWRPKQTPED